MKLTDEEYDAVHRYMTGKTLREEARDSATMLGSALLMLIVFVVVGFIIIVVDR